MTKIEEIAASNQQHKEKSLKEQETKLSNDRNTTELRRTHESIGDQEAFLVNLGQLDICEIKKIAEIIEIYMRMESMHAITSARRTFPFCLSQHARRIASGVWLERRAELEEAKNIGHAVESSRCAEDEEGSAYAILRNRVKPAKH